MIDLHGLLASIVYEAGVTFVRNQLCGDERDRASVASRWASGALCAMEHCAHQADASWRLWDTLHGWRAPGHGRSFLQLLADEAGGEAFDRMRAELADHVRAYEVTLGPQGDVGSAAPVVPPGGTREGAPR